MISFVASATTLAWYLASGWDVGRPVAPWRSPRTLPASRDPARGCADVADAAPEDLRNGDAHLLRLAARRHVACPVLPGRRCGSRSLLHPLNFGLGAAVLAMVGATIGRVLPVCARGVHRLDRGRHFAPASWLRSVCWRIRCTRSLDGRVKPRSGDPRRGRRLSRHRAPSPIPSSRPTPRCRALRATRASRNGDWRP